MSASYRLHQFLERTGVHQAALRAYHLTGASRLRKLQVEARYRAAAEKLRQAGSTITNPAGYTLHVLSDDRRAHALLVNRGCLDLGLQELWQKLVDLLQPTLVIDAGANYGDVSLSAKYPEHTRLILVEPNPAIVSCLRTTVETNDLSNVQVIPCALSDASATVTLRVDASYSGTASVSRNVGSHNTVVEASRLDDLVHVDEPGICLLKLDVEGHELAVLRGSTELLNRAALWLAVCEFPHLSPDEVDELHERYDVQFVNTYTHKLRRSTPDAMRTLQRRRTHAPWLKDVIVRRKPETPTTGS